ncbi:MAG: hypothetical protein AB7O62_09835 [Pirellulales bacterium]
MVSRLLLPLTVFLIAAGLLWWHQREWHQANARPLDDADRLFHARRYRRRMQASGMLALIGVALAGGQSMDIRQNPSLYVYFWFGVIGLVLWACALALADALSTHLHAARGLRQHQITRAQLAAEIARYQQQKGDQPPADDQQNESDP